MNDRTRFDDLIDEAIDKLASGNMSEGVEAMVEIAQYFARAGQEMSSWLNLRRFIIESAKRKDACPILIETMVKEAERLSYEQRNGTRIITNVTSKGSFH